MGDFDTEQGLKGAAGGALSGAALGTQIMPGWGTAIGAVGGGLIGLFGGGFGGGESEDEQKSRQMLMEYYRRIQNRQPITPVTASQGTVSDVRNRQLTLADQLSAMGRGEGPSLAEAQLRSATDRNAAQQSSFANSGRGGPMAASRAANNTALLGARAAQDAASARIQERNAALQLLGLNLHGIRSGDEEMSRFNAGQRNEVATQNMWARLKQMGMDDEAALAIIGKLQGQNTEISNRPGTGDQLMAGGAGMFSLASSMRAQAKAAQGQGTPSQPSLQPSGGVTQPSQTGMFGQYQRPYV